MSPSPATKTIHSQWVRFRCCSYLGGKGLSWGCSNDPIVPFLAMDGGKYCLNVDTIRTPHTDILDNNLSIIAKDSLDHAFVGARADTPPLREIASKLKIGSHLVIHSINLDVDKWRELVAAEGLWQEKDTYVRQDQFLGVWKLLGRVRTEVLPPKPRAAKRACIARYGAIGDMIMISPLIRKLAEDGYEVTLNVTPYCADVLKHNPYVHNIVLQERDMIPNQDLGPYWSEWIPDYDKYINLSESIEGKLLKVEGRRDFYTTKEWRATDTNYFDQTMRLGGYPEAMGAKGELYFSNAEHKQAKHFRDRTKDQFLIMWALKGSSHHKQYPLLEPALTEWLDEHPRAIAMLVGAQADSNMQFTHRQVIGMCGEMSLREVFCLEQYVDLVGGPESSVTNAAGCYDVPKITMLSHSTHSNLCKYWTNDYCIQADVDCTGCMQLHYSKESCPCVTLSDSEGNQIWEGPKCAGAGFPMERVKARLDEVYNKWESKRAHV